MCLVHLRLSLRPISVFLRCFTAKTCVQSVTCVVAVILKEDRCGTIAELGALNDGQQ